MTEFIEIRGARENNLKDVSLRIPKREITIFTGVSGSGKSSVVFDTIATEAQRQLYENFSLFIRSFLPRYPQPDADGIENLSMAVIVDQKRLGGGSHSTVGTITDIYTVLRLLFSRLGKPHAGYASAFSFNDPTGHVPRVQRAGPQGRDRRGRLPRPGQVAQRGRDPGADVGRLGDRRVHRVGLLRQRQASCATSRAEEMDLLLWGKDRKYKLPIGDKTMNASYVGVLEKIERAYVRRDIKTLSERVQKAVEPYLRPRVCPACRGARLNQAALRSRIDGYSIADLSAMEVGDLVPILRLMDDGEVGGPIFATLLERLGHVVDIGLDYLSLDRETDTLSGGESQRIKMVKHLGSSLVDVTYIFDEPSIGLHPRDVHRLNELLVKLRDKGNTVHRRRARPGRHPGRRPRRRHGPGRGQRRRRGRVRGLVRRPPHVRHADRRLPRAIAADQGAACGRRAAGCRSGTPASTT